MNRQMKWKTGQGVREGKFIHVENAAHASPSGIKMENALLQFLNKRKVIWLPVELGKKCFQRLD